MARYDLRGSRVWITGASSGIGEATAWEFARRGCRVALSARNEVALNAIAEKINAAYDPKRALALPLDVTDRQANLDAAQEIRGAFGGLDIAFLNAGNCEYVDVENFDSGLFARVMNVNFMGIVHGVEAVLPLLNDSLYPRLVGMSSTACYAPFPRNEAYGASKAAIRYLFESLRLDLKKQAIPVTVVFPGFVKTPLTDRNEFRMPMIVSAEEAARAIVGGIERGKLEIEFPRRFSRPLRALGALPVGLRTHLFARLAGSSS